MKTRMVGEDTTPEELRVIISELEGKLRKKTEDLTRTRHRLSKARINVKRLKEIVIYQRDRIIELV